VKSAIVPGRLELLAGRASVGTVIILALNIILVLQTLGVEIPGLPSS